MVEKKTIVVVAGIGLAIGDPSIGHGNAAGVGDLGQVDGVGVDALVVEHGAVDGDGPTPVHVGVGSRARVAAQVV